MSSRSMKMNTSKNKSGKRVGILTFPCSISHGAVLQMYALYETILSMGYDVEIINYYNEYMRKTKHFSSFREIRTVKAVLRRAFRRIVHWKLYRGFQSFEKRMTHYPSGYFSSKTELRALSGRYQSVVCGSDQVWNPDITGYDTSFFLDFCDDKTRRIAYAPSFGNTDYPEAFRASISEELARFYALSVREVQGQKKVYEISGRNPELVLDPTFLIAPEQWAQLEEPCAVEEPYILYYSLRHTKEILHFCERLSEEKKMKIVVIGGNIFNAVRHRKTRLHYLRDIDPAHWLYLVSHAAYIVTNSFHGLAFSIIFRKNFFLALTSLTNSRLENLVSLLGLESQIIRGDCKLNETNYDVADRVLPEMRKNSLEYLETALK